VDSSLPKTKDKRNVEISRRVKKMGLPQRYRLFFRAFDTPELKAIVILWLGFPRKEKAKNDCYEVFTKMVAVRTFPDSLDELIAEAESNQ
jgi:toxin YhaV